MLKNLALSFLATLCIFVAKPIIGQNTTENEVQIVMLEYEKGSFWELNPLTGERALQASYETQLGQILDFEVDPELNVVYFLEGAGCCGGLTAGESRVSRLDLDSEKVDIIFSGRNVYGIDRVPDVNYLLLSYYNPELESIRSAARDGLIEHCMLDLRSQTCTGERGVSNYNHIGWVSQDRFIGKLKTASFQEMSYLVNSASLSRVELPVHTPYWTSIPSTDEILSTTGVGAGSFTRINLDTLDIASYIVEGDFDSSAQFYPVSFSPNGYYFLFAYGHSHMVAEFATGEVITVLPNIFDPQWVDDSNLIYSFYADLGHYPGELYRHNVLSDKHYRLASFNERVKFTVVSYQ